VSDAAVAALFAAIPMTLAALGSLIVGIITAIRSRDNGRKADTILNKAEAIHEVTNGTLHQVEASNRELTERVRGLEKALAASVLSGTAAASLAAEAASTAVQSATDVRTAQASPPPGEQQR
jgi:hypothetical protein